MSAEQRFEDSEKKKKSQTKNKRAKILMSHEAREEKSV
jgi:hypothetical protein